MSRRTPYSLLLAAVAAIVFAVPALTGWLEYDRGAVARGEVWRLVSAHWVHFGVEDFFWDLVAFVALGIACEKRSRTRFLACIAVSTIAISLCVAFAMSGLTVYRGLSGIDSALIALLCAQLWAEAAEPADAIWPLVGLAAFMLKSAFELTTGRTLFVHVLAANAKPLPAAHLVGAVVGFVMGVAGTFQNPTQSVAARPAAQNAATMAVRTSIV